MAEKILIVDDEVETLRLISIALRRQGYQIVAANSGLQALELAYTENPDLIILDIMMPDIDGFEVARRLNRSKKTENIPLLMFSAKNQLDDKVMGYEAGADDYLTKPIHPAELVSHVKSLLEQKRSLINRHENNSYNIGVLGAVGGVGTSTVVINLACYIAQKMRTKLTATELTPGHGTFHVIFGGEDDSHIENLLEKNPGEITLEDVQEELIRLSYGPLLLPSSTELSDTKYFGATDQIEVVMGYLNEIAPINIFDFGTLVWTNYKQLLGNCDELLVITAPYPGTLEKTKILIRDLADLDFGRMKPLNVVSVNRARSTISLTMTEMEAGLDHTIAQVIPSAPEHAYQAEQAHKPMIYTQTGSLVVQQFNHLGDQVIARIKEYKHQE
ncbi:MAG: response regulator [Anaerolineaceae bacterium]|nr:response regulator [Anaerolineaceae bacterium]